MLAATSCTIVQDSDITDPAAFEKFKLKNFSITQDTHNGKKTTTATLLYDSAVNVKDPATGSIVVRKMMYNFPNPGNLKVRMRSGSSAELKLTCSYLSGNKPYTVVLYQNDSAVEIYRFRYNNGGNLNRIVTTINPVDNKPFIYHTNDTLIYTGSGIVTKILRRSPDASAAATINIEYGGAGDYMSISNFQYQYFHYQQMQGDCPNNSEFNACTGYAIQFTGVGGTGGTGGNNSSYYTISTRVESDLLHQLNLADTKIQGGQTSQRDYDTYYFHPLMFLRNQMNQGNFLFVIYTMDWLLPGPVLTQTNFGRNDFVTLDFQYGF